MKKDNWIFIIFILTFILSVIFSGLSNVISANCNDIVLIIILIIVMGLGIIFDMIGTSAITANEASFHSMSSARVNGAKETINLLKHANRVSSVCNDVVGDVCGIISGGIGAVLSISLALHTGVNNTLIAILVSAFISSVTVGGKAICKQIALKKSNDIIFVIGKLKYLLKIK